MKRMSFKGRGMRKKFIPLIVLVTVLICGCGTPEKELSGGSVFAFDTYMTLSYDTYSEESFEDIKREIGCLEETFSVTKDTSEIARLNKEKRINASSDVVVLFSKAIAASERTGGAFDITSYPYVKAWGFSTGEETVPREDELKELSAFVGYSKISVDGNKVSLSDDASVDLGGIAKGYLGDVLADKLVKEGCESGILSLGGNIRVIGKKTNGSLWRIGIRDPRDREKLLGVVEVEDTNVITSGGYERYFTDEAGNEYWHIIDPFTGKPANNGIISVTVIGRDGAMCDALSTGLFVMGEERAKEIYKSSDDFEMIIAMKDGRILVSEEISKAFTKDGYQRGRIEVVSGQG